MCRHHMCNVLIDSLRFLRSTDASLRSKEERRSQKERALQLARESFELARSR
jgi:hypothetical protein